MFTLLTAKEFRTLGQMEIDVLEYALKIAAESSDSHMRHLAQSMLAQEMHKRFVWAKPI